MRFSAIRGFLIGCLAMFAAAFSIAAPASAVPVSFAHVETIPVFERLDVLVAPEHAVVASEQERIQAPEARSSADLGPLPPVYALSLRTDGQSLSGYHLRC